MLKGSLLRKGKDQTVSVLIQHEGTLSLSYRRTMRLNMEGLLETWPNVEVRSVNRILCEVRQR